MKRKLLFAIAALLCSVGVQRVHAAAADYLSGWTEISELPAAANLGDYYFVFVATEADLMMAQEVGTGKIGDAQEDKLTMVYRTPASPLTNKKFVWMLSYDETFKYGIRNLNDATKYMQSRGSWPWRVQFEWETAQSKWTIWNLAYANGAWTIENNACNNEGEDTYFSDLFIGPWNSKAFADNNVVAGNKTGDEVGKFKIYSILRSAFKSSENDVTATYLKNPSFEYTNAEKDPASATGGLSTLYGWTIPSLGATSNVSLGSSSACDGQAAGIPTPADGSIYYFNRKGWNSSANTYTLTTTTESLPVGSYALTIRYKGVDSYESAHQEKGSTIGLNAKQGETTLATITSGEFDAYDKGNGTQASLRNAYFTSHDWSLLTLPFTVTSEGTVDINIVQTMKGGTRTDIVIDYLTLEKLVSDWTTTGSNYYLLNGNDQFLAGGNDWGTHAITNVEGLDLTIGGDSKGITIDTKLNNGGSNQYLNGVYCDGAAGSKWFAISIGDGWYNLTQDGKNYLISNGAGANLTTTTNPSTANARWQFITKASRIADLASATKASPKDATFMIQDGNFGRNDKRWSSWTTSSSNSGQFKVAGDNENLNLQQWDGYATISQNITDLPKGSYKMTVQGFYRPGGSSTSSTAQNVTLFAGNNEEPLMLHTSDAVAEKDNTHGFTTVTNAGTYAPNTQNDCSKAFTYGAYVNTIDNIVNTTGSFAIGAKNTTTLSYQWMVVDNFRLYYYGPNIVEKATALSNGGTMTANKWYYIDMVDGDFTLTASSNLANIVVCDGTTLIEDEADETTAITNGHFSGRYYVKSTEEQTLTWSTTTRVIDDGTYYFKEVGKDVFLTRGGNYGTEAVTEIHGISFVATMLSDGTYTLKNYDHSVAINADKYFDGSYTDQTAFHWMIEDAGDDKIYLKKTALDYVKMPVYSGEARPYGYVATTTNPDEATKWQLMSKSEYDTYLAARQTTQITAIATAATLSATSLSELESEIAALKATDCTSNISNAALTDGEAQVTGWTVLKYGNYSNKTPGVENGNACEVWNGTGGLRQTISDLPEGLYKVTVDACYRLGANDDALRIEGNPNILAYIKATTTTSENLVQVKNWFDFDGARPTNRSSFSSVASNYRNTLFVYVSEGEDLTLEIGVPGSIANSWMPFKNWTLTRYENYSISEEDDAAPSEVDDVNVTLTRTLAADKWNTFSVPFDFTVAGSPLDGARVMKFNSATDNIITMEDADEVVAGDPYLVKPTSDIVNPTFEGVDIENPTPEAKGTGDYKFKAQLYYTALATDGSVAYLANDGETVKRLNDSGTGKIKGLRAIFLVPAEVSAKGVVIKFGDADGVVKLDADGNITEDATIYNLAGQRLNEAQKGVNIINGKKVLVK